MCTAVLTPVLTFAWPDIGFFFLFGDNGTIFGILDFAMAAFWILMMARPHFDFVSSFGARDTLVRILDSKWCFVFSLIALCGVLDSHGVVFCFVF